MKPAPLEDSRSSQAFRRSQRIRSVFGGAYYRISVDTDSLPVDGCRDVVDFLGDGLAVPIAGGYLTLTRAEFLVLVELARHPYRTLDREALAAAMPSVAPDSGSSASPPVEIHASRLQEKLRGAGVDCVKTIRCAGYRFADVQADSDLPRH